jgi:phosphoglycerate kinase
MIRFLRTTNKRLLRGTALVRLDFNTQDDWRMKAAIPTIKLLLSTSEKVVIVSHRGRPENVKMVNGVPSGYEKSLSLKKDAADLSGLLRTKVIFVPHFRFAEMKNAVPAAPRGSVFLLENLRFLKGEEENSPSFARSLATLADFYVNDAFAVSHRANASVAAIAKFLPSYAGLELEKEMLFLGKVMQRPKRPLVFVIGGAKAADKLAVIRYFKNKADWFLLGGGPANTILGIRGLNIKKSVADADPKDLKNLKTISRYSNIVLPEDYVWHNGMILDIGIKTEKVFREKIAKAKSIIWSGSVGMTDRKAYQRGSMRIADAIVKNRKAFSVAGGGETVLFLKKYGFDRKFSFISTGGGAMLDFLAGKKLPGIEALRNAKLKDVN